MTDNPARILYAKFNGAPIPVRAEFPAPEPWHQLHEGVLMRVLPFPQVEPFLSGGPLRRSAREPRRPDEPRP